MPRKARIDAPGALHHIIIRGIERKAIFKDDADRTNFVGRLDRIISETETGCYAWVLMTNHVHLLLKTGAAPVATVMRRLLTGYAVSFNRRHRRHGQLFQNRYKSFLCEEQVLKQADEQLQEKYRLQKKVVSLQALVEKVAHYFKIDPRNLKSASKERIVTEARRVFCYIAVRKLGYKCSDVSRALDISASTASNAVRFGSRISEIGEHQKQILENGDPG